MTLNNTIPSVPKLTLSVCVMSGFWLLGISLILFYFISICSLDREIYLKVLKPAKKPLNKVYDITGTVLSPESKVITEFSSGIVSL